MDKIIYSISAILGVNYSLYHYFFKGYKYFNLKPLNRSIVNLKNQNKHIIVNIDENKNLFAPCITD